MLSAACSYRETANDNVLRVQRFSGFYIVVKLITEYTETIANDNSGYLIYVLAVKYF